MENAVKVIGKFDIIIGKEVVAVSKPCNPATSGFRKGLEMIAEKHGVPVTRIKIRRHHEKRSLDACRAAALAAMAQ